MRLPRRSGRAAVCLLAALSAPGGGEVVAQAVGRRPPPVVEVQLGMPQLTTPLPFSEVFILSVAVPNGAKELELSYGPYDGTRAPTFPDDRIGTEKIEISPVLQQREVGFRIEPLEPDRWYLFELRVATKTIRDGETADSTKATARFSGQAQATYRTHFDADFGVLYAPDTDFTGLFLGTHVHALPINKNSPDSPGFWERFSAFAGITVLEISAKAPIEEQFPVGNFVTGVGARLHGPLRVNAGVMFFKQKDANPLIDRKVQKRDLFASVTADFGVRQVFGSLTGLLGIR